MPHLLHGGDYNPEQWPRATWAEDDKLMSLAHWNAVTMGIFSWVSLEPEEGRYTFDWMDEILDTQAKAGRVVGLATPSAAPPAWLSHKYPETLRVGSNGVRHRHGNRVNYCWTSPVYRRKVKEIATQIAKRYGNHPALAYWHVSNEYGGECYCDLCQAAFRKFLKAQYKTLDALNDAYWTRFWSHTYTDWEQIEAPGEPYGENAIIGLTLDWKRFVSDQIIDFYRNEAGVLREIAPTIPATTNLMGAYPVIDGHKIAQHMDFIAWDSYPWFHSTPADSSTWLYTSFCHDLNRSFKHKPFLLMECTPSSSNWYPVMALKRPRAHTLEGIQAIAHGADGVQYFQWRQGRGSSEQFHGAVVAHINTPEARVFQEVAELGKTMEQLSGVVGAKTTSEVALVYDWEVCWAVDAVAAPRTKKREYLQTALSHYQSFWSQGISVDVLSSEADFTGYKVVVAPMLFMLKPGVAEHLAAFVKAGGTLVTTYWSAIVNETGLAFVGGYPEPLRSLLGIWSEEIDALYDDQQNQVVAGESEFFEQGNTYAARDLCELIHAEGAEVLATYGSDFYKGRPAVTRNVYGKGQAIYVASRNEQSFNDDLLTSLCLRLGVRKAVSAELPAGLTVQRRSGVDADYLFFLNCTAVDAVVEVGGCGLQDLDGNAVSTLTFAPFESKVLVACIVGSATELVTAK
jgi:beta-galactosidase